MPLGRNSLTLNGGFVYVVLVTSTFAIKSLVLNCGPMPRYKHQQTLFQRISATHIIFQGLFSLSFKSSDHYFDPAQVNMKKLKAM
jgi:hypothetical protein